MSGNGHPIKSMFGRLRFKIAKNYRIRRNLSCGYSNGASRMRLHMPAATRLAWRLLAFAKTGRIVRFVTGTKRSMTSAATATLRPCFCLTLC